ACSPVRNRGERRKNTKPTNAAPPSTAAMTARGSLSPQIFTETLLMASSGREQRRDLERDAGGGRGWIGRRGDGPADDQEVGAGFERFGGRHDALLIVGGGPGGAHARADE